MAAELEPLDAEPETALRRAARALLLFDEARLVLSSFAAAGVRAVALKGLSLHARGLYPSPTERPMNDVDLLVRPEQARKAHEILLELGYRPHHVALVGDAPAFNAEAQRRRGAENPKDCRFSSATPPLRASAMKSFRRIDAYFSAAGDLNYIHRDRPGAWIDLHWNLARCDRFKGSVRMDAGEMVEAAILALPGAGHDHPPAGPRHGAALPEPRNSGRCIAGAGINTLPFPVRLLRPDHEILYFASHHAIFNHGTPSHTLEDAKRLIDYCGFWIACPPKSLDRLARRWGVRRALQKTLHDLSVKNKFEREGESPPRLVAGALKQLLHEPAMLDTWPDRARWLRRVLFPDPAWRTFAYGAPPAGPARHWRALAARLNA